MGFKPPEEDEFHPAAGIWGASKIDGRAFSSEEVESCLGLSASGDIPRLGRKIEPFIIAEKCPQQFAEAFRGLRANVMLQCVSQGSSRAIAICSSVPAEGKSTVSINLALTSAQAGIRTLLIDTDIRRGMMGVRLGIPARTPGFGDFLSTRRSWREFVVRGSESNLSIMTSGLGAMASVDLLLSEECGQFLDEAKKEYQLVVLDTAPLLVVHDATKILRHVDLTALVVRMRFTNLRNAARVRHIIRRYLKSEPLLILNASPKSHLSPDYYNYPTARAT
jgi:capsular exopolysaccharide synthesis family protein